MVKRGVYAKGLRNFPSEVECPTTPEDCVKLSRSIQVTQQNVKRWASSNPENCGRAKAYLLLQEAARSEYRAWQTPDDRRQEAVLGRSAFAKQSQVVATAVDKLVSIGEAGYALAVDSNHTPESLTNNAVLASAATAAASNPPTMGAVSNRPKRSRRPVDDEAAAINADTDAELAKIFVS